jgi:cell wall-associated NlpC family hydrolase
MSQIVRAETLVREAKKTLGWKYKWGKSEAGLVDCSGLIVYLMSGLGGRVPYHGTNTMYRIDVDGMHLPLNQAKPGYLCFKVRAWTEKEKANRNYGKEPGDVYHVGIMSDNCKIINAASPKLGVIESDPGTWDSCARLKGVDYDGLLDSKTAFDYLLDELSAVIEKYRREID